jgi:hypothetical protein
MNIIPAIQAHDPDLCESQNVNRLRSCARGWDCASTTLRKSTLSKWCTLLHANANNPRARKHHQLSRMTIIAAKERAPSIVANPSRRSSNLLQETRCMMHDVHPLPEKPTISCALRVPTSLLHTRSGGVRWNFPCWMSRARSDQKHKFGMSPQLHTSLFCVPSVRYLSPIVSKTRLVRPST